MTKKITTQTVKATVENSGAFFSFTASRWNLSGDNTKRQYLFLFHQYLIIYIPFIKSAEVDVYFIRKQLLQLTWSAKILAERIITRCHCCIWQRFCCLHVKMSLLCLCLKCDLQHISKDLNIHKFDQSYFTPGWKHRSLHRKLHRMRYNVIFCWKSDAYNTFVCCVAHVFHKTHL